MDRRVDRWTDPGTDEQLDNYRCSTSPGMCSDILIAPWQTLSANVCIVRTAAGVAYSFSDVMRKRLWEEAG